MFFPAASLSSTGFAERELRSRSTSRGRGNFQLA
jgi:hypothetical protein